jgi:hypothetical protein
VFDRACALLDAALSGDARRQALVRCCEGTTPSRALARLRDALDGNLRAYGPEYAALDAIIRDGDLRTRREGFHVLHDWDGKAGRVNRHSIAVDVAGFAVERRGDEPGHETAAAILLDYHYLHVLALLSLRAWDDGDPNANLDRLGALLAALQGTGGSGHRFASRASTLLLIATAHYEPEERGYGTLLDKVRELDERHRLAVALDHAVAMGCHLRFGFQASYGRDVAVMRDDNVADYPWLRFAVMTLLDQDTPDRDEIAEGIVNGVAADPSAFAARPEFAARFDAHRAALLAAFERFRPGEHAYSPLALFFNFSHNLVKGLVVDAVLRGRPWDVSVNDLLTSLPPDHLRQGYGGPPKRSAKAEGGSYGGTDGSDGGAGGSDGNDPKIDAATTLMEHARRNPDRIRGRLTPAIVYDPATGRHGVGHAMRQLGG